MNNYFTIIMEKILESIEITVNDEPLNYKITRLKEETKCFKVDRRYKIDTILPDISKKIRVKLKINFFNENAEAGSETDENLFAVSFYFGGHKLCIGTTGDIPELFYEYTENSIVISGIFPCETVSFYLAYVDTVNETTELSAWLAADPFY